MPFWDGPETIVPAFEGKTDAGGIFRTADCRQFRHMVIAFADEAGPALSELAARAEDIRANTATLVVVAPPGAELGLPPQAPVVRDEGGVIAAKYREIVPEWNTPMVFVADRYGELTAFTDGRDPRPGEHAVQWVFSNEVQCAL